MESHSVIASGDKRLRTMADFRGASSRRRPSIAASASAPCLATDTSASSTSPVAKDGASPRQRTCSSFGGRFKDEERACFNKRPDVTTLSPTKAQSYFKSTGMRRTVLSLGGLHTLPTSKGNFWAAGLTGPDSRPDTRTRSEQMAATSRPQELEQERLTAQVLAKIYPCTPKRGAAEATDAAWQLPDGYRSGGSSPTASHTRGSVGFFNTRTSFGMSTSQSGTQTATTRKKKIELKLVDFRQAIVEKFSTMQKAFDTFVLQTDSYTKELSLKEFSRFLHKHFPDISKDECEHLFDHLDVDKNGAVSMQEFHAAIEAIAPVHTIEDLRRKWIALGFKSIRKVLFMMWEPHTTGEGNMKRLSFADFCVALARVGISEEAEAQRIFNYVYDANDKDPTTANTVSFDMLWSALAAVSPYLLLEDVRDTLLKRYETFDKAFSAAGYTGDRIISNQEFMKIAISHWKLTPSEASKAFRIIDGNGSSRLSQTEIVGALRLSEPSLFLEDVRRKVRQRFRSIKESLMENNPQSRPGTNSSTAVDRETMSTPVLGTRFKRTASIFYDEPCYAGQYLMQRMDLQALSRTRKTAEQISSKLSTVQLSDAETKLLWERIDVNGDGRLSEKEFHRGLELFAPSCKLEDLRLRCLKSSARVADIFADLPDQMRKTVMDAAGFQELLERFNFADNVDTRFIFDLIERTSHNAFENRGGFAVAELVVALQSAASGGQTPLPPDERDARARQNVRWQLAPFIRTATELRAECRQPQLEQSTTSNTRFGEAHSVSPRGGGRGSARTTPRAGGISKLALRSSGRQHRATRQGSKQQRHAFRANTPTKHSYRRVSTLVGTLPSSEGGQIVEKLHGYYQSVGGVVVDNEALLKEPQSRFARYLIDRQHEAVLARNV